MTIKTKFAFTDANLVALKARDVRFEVYDTVEPGLELRVTPQGTKTFRRRKSGESPVTLGRFIKGAEGKRTAEELSDAIEMTVEQARTQCRITSGKYAEGIDVAATKRVDRARDGLRAESVGALLELYMSRQTYVEGQPLRPHTISRYRSIFWHFFGGDEGLARPYASLTPALLVELHIAASRKRRGPCRDGRVRQIGSRFNADKVVQVLDAMAKLLKLGEPLSEKTVEERGVATIRSAPARVDPEDLPARAAWLTKYLRREKDGYRGLIAQQYLIALSTGMRMATISQLTWEMLVPVPKQEGRFYLDTPAEIQKIKLPFLVPLPPRATEVVIARRDRLIAAGIKPAGLMFPRIRSGKPARDCKLIASDIVADLGDDADFTTRDLRKAMNTVHGMLVRTPDFIRRLLMNRKTKDVEEEHYMAATVRKKIATLQVFSDEAEEWAYNGVPSDRRLAELRRAAFEASKILSAR